MPKRYEGLTLQDRGQSSFRRRTTTGAVVVVPNVALGVAEHLVWGGNPYFLGLPHHLGAPAGLSSGNAKLDIAITASTVVASVAGALAVNRRMRTPRSAGLNEV